MKYGILILSLKTSGVLIAAGLLALTVVPASASVLFTTGLAAGNDPAFTASGTRHDVQLQTSSFGQYLILADPFSVTADAIATDLFVPLSLAGSSPPFSNGPAVDFSIVSDVSGLPDSDSGGNPVGALYTGAATGITGTTGTVYDVNLTGTATLVAGTTYWLIAMEPGFSPSPGCSPQSPCTPVYDDWYNNNSSTNTAGDLSDFENGWTVPSPQSNLALTLVGTSAAAAAPEPSSFVLLALGILGVLFGRARFLRGARTLPRTLPAAFTLV